MRQKLSTLKFKNSNWKSSKIRANKAEFAQSVYEVVGKLLST